MPTSLPTTRRPARPHALLAVFCALLVLATSATAWAGVEVDAASSSSAEASALTFPLTVGSGAQRFLLVGVAVQSAESVTAVTYAGRALTAIVSKATGGGPRGGSVSLYQLVAPPSGTAKVVVTLTGPSGVIAGATAFTGVDHSLPVGGIISNGGTKGSKLSSLIASRPGDIVFDVVQSDATTLSAHGAQSEQWNLNRGGRGGGSIKPGAASVTMSWPGGDGAWAQVVASVKQAGAPDKPKKESETADSKKEKKDKDAGPASEQADSAPDADALQEDINDEPAPRTATNGSESKKAPAPGTDAANKPATDPAKTATTSTGLAAMMEAFAGLTPSFSGGADTRSNTAAAGSSAAPKPAAPSLPVVAAPVAVGVGVPAKATPASTKTAPPASSSRPGASAPPATAPVPAAPPTPPAPPAPATSKPVPGAGASPAKGSAAADNPIVIQSVQGSSSMPRPGALAIQEVLAGGAAVKLSIRAEGWYRVTQPQLVAAGLSSIVDPRTLQLFVDGVEQPIKVSTSEGRFGAGDAIEFYGTGVDTPYTDTRVYWLTANRQSGLRLRSVTSPTTGAGARSFPFTVESKERSIYFSALQNGDTDNFFGALITNAPSDLTLTVRHLDTLSTDPASIVVALQGVTDTLSVNPDHHVAVSINGTSVGQVEFDGRQNHEQTLAVPPGVLIEGDNTVTLTALGDESDVSLVDVVRLTYAHTHSADSGSLRLTSQGQRPLSINGFTTAAIRVFDVTDPLNLVEVFGDVSGGAGAFSVAFTVPASGVRTLLAVDAAHLSAPASIRANRASSWTRSGNTGDYVLISHGDFLGALAPLKAWRSAQGHTVAVVDVEDIYDEFSFGQKTPYALRDFLTRAKAAWSLAPRFVTLVGNATTDPRDYLGMNEPDFVPTKLVPTQSLETASDDWFADAQGDGVPGLAVGRLPARTPGQAGIMVSKIVAYEQGSEGAWNKSVTLVADENDAGGPDFEASSARVKELIPPDYSVGEILRGQVGTPAARTALLSRIADGQAIVNYTGHGSVQIWRDDLLTSDDAPTLTNASHLPLFVMMNCLNGFFQSLFPEESLAEALVRAGGGGAVAVWASSGMTDSAAQSALSAAFYRLLFEGKYQTVGEAIAAAKATTNDRDVRRTWIFFGDAAMRLKGARVPATFVATEPRPASGSGGSGGSGGGSAPAPAPAHVLASSEPAAMRLADWNGDGRADVLVTSGAAWHAVLSTPGGDQVRDGVWGVAWEAYPAKLNGDQTQDLLLFDRVTGTWAQAINDGAMRFYYSYGAWGVEYTLQVADLNGDGADDVLLTNPATGVWFTALNDRAGSFVYRSGQWQAESVVTLGDWTGDGWTDVFVHNKTTGAWTLGVSDGTGGFWTFSGVWSAGWTVQAANLNGDARADLLLYNQDTGAWAEYTSGSTGLVPTSAGVWNPGLSVRSLDAPRASGERDDVLLYSAATGQATVITTRGQATGAWPAGRTVATGDLNGDGRTDVVLFDATSGLWVPILR